MTGKIDDGHLPDEQAWDRAARAGQRTAHNALIGLLSRRLERDDNTYNTIAVLVGALTETARLLGGTAAIIGYLEGGQRNFEESAIAYVRGAMRGKEEPIDESGAPWGSA